jgi:hypothetical protein
MTKIEAVARAMWERRRTFASEQRITLEAWGDGSVPRANGVMEEARAAIEAIREPTEDMADCAHLSESLASDTCKDVYRTMISVALGEREPHHSG